MGFNEKFHVAKQVLFEIQSSSRRHGPPAHFLRHLGRSPRPSAL